jgi:hypothetical protein
MTIRDIIKEANQKRKDKGRRPYVSETLLDESPIDHKKILKAAVFGLIFSVFFTYVLLSFLVYSCSGEFFLTFENIHHLKNCCADPKQCLEVR